MYHPSVHSVETRTNLSTLIDLLRLRSFNEPTLTAYRFLADAGDASPSVTYAELDLRARAIAAVLQSRSLQNERALLLYRQGLDFIAAFFGCIYAGTIAVPSRLPQAKRDRLQTIANDAQAACVLTTNENLEGIAREPWTGSLQLLATDTVSVDHADDWREPSTNNRSLAYLQYTSGSTSTPKGVMVTHANVLENSAYIQHGFEHGPNSVSLSWLPHFHDMGLVDGIIQPLYSGFTGLLMSPAAFLQDPARWLQAITRYRVTHSGGPNFAYDLCVRRIDEAQRASLDLSSWSVAYNGAEPVRHETLERFVAAFAPYGFRRQTFYPAYGLAEATLKVTGRGRDDGPVYRVVQAAALENHRVVQCDVDAPDSRTLVGCGHTALETEVVIVNPESSSVCAPDEVGEIWVSGPGVAAGYWNCPEETERTFNARLARPGGQGSFLRTGDLGFVLDGELFLTGRLKDLIIIRGRNHYPQDIELAMQSAHAALKPNGGAAFSVDIEGEERLVVVHECERSAESAAVIAAVRTAIVDEFDIQPAAVVLIRSGTLPKTSSGKVRRAACREAFLSRSLRTPVLIAEWRAPLADDQKSVVQWLHQLLTQKLESPLVELNQPLARYGIDSLTALELKHAVETSLGVKLPLTSFLQNQTVADLAGVILASEHAPSRLSAMDQAREFSEFPEFHLSHGQQSLWAVQNVSPESTAYNVTFAARINGELNLNALHKTFETLVQRHPLLRARFPSRDGAPVCVITEKAEISLRVEDVAGDAELRDRLQAIAETSFDLENGPLLRASLFRKSAHEHVILLSAHHIIVDYWSLAILLRELGEMYETDAAPVLTTTVSHYSEYVRQQAELLEGREGERLRDYWLSQLAGELPVIDLPTDRARPAVQTYRGASLSVQMDQQTTKQLQQLAVDHEATLFMTLLAAFQVLLYRYTGQKEILVGAPSSGRVVAEFADIVGYFVNPLVLRATIPGDKSFAEFLDETRQTVLAAFEHQEYPFDLLVKQLQPQRDPARSPLFQVMFAFQKGGLTLKLGGLPMEPIVLDQRAAQFDLSLTVAEVESGFDASFEYNTDLFDTSTIERLHEHFAVLLESIVSDPSTSLAELQLLSNATRRQLLYDWNDTEVSFGSFACVHELIAQQAVGAPDQIAIASGAETLSYRELNARANRLAHYLRALGVGPEVPVGICLPRSAAMVTCVLGVLKAGGVYVPLDPSYPKERLDFMIEDSGAALLLNEQFLDREATAIDTENDADPSVVTTSENLAYIIYTSGSTGTPKGVMVQHGALTNYIRAANRAYEIVPEDRILQFAPFSFDASVEEIFVCLTSGATLVLRDGETPKSPIEFMHECREKKLTVLDLPTAYWHELVAYLDGDDWATARDLRLVIIGGDKALPDRVKRWHYAVGPRVRLVNTYGPTEATVVATICEGPHADVSIGRPVANTHAYILDEQLQPVIPGARGELCLGGANVSRGYRGDPGLTAKMFVPDPFSSVRGARLYRTGDLARWRSDGLIEFLGRVDQQVKIRGHRIEPVEIETALLTHEAVSDAVVVAREEASGERRLAAYVVGNRATPVELRSFLTARLPPHLIPASFTLLDVLPRLPSGKIDRRALPSPDHSAIDGSYVAPTTSTERVLCDLWAEVLKLERAGIHDNFFALGGDSILSIQVAARARLAGLHLSPSQIFQHPTPTALSAVTSSVHTHHAEIEPLTGDVPLTPIQHWFFEQQFSTPDHWNMALMLETHERLDPDLLDQAFVHVIRHHDALRLRFTKTSGGWRQFLPGIDVQEKIIRVVHLADENEQHLIANETQAQLDLANGVLLRAVLFEPREGPQRLLIVIHHLAVDGVSWRILLADLDHVYRQLRRDEAVTLPPKTTSFARWARLLPEYANSEKLRHELAYWTSLASQRVKPLPIDFPDGSNVEADTQTVMVVLDLAHVNGTQINDVLLTALLDALSHWTNQQSVLIELERHGREDLFDDADLSRTVGWFTDQFPVLLEAKPGLSPIALLQSVKQQLRSIPGRGIGYGLLRYLNHDTELRRLPAPEVSFNYLGQLDQMLDDSKLFSLSSESCAKTRHPSARRGALLEINAYVSKQQLRVDWGYSSDLHRRQTIENLAERFIQALRTIIAELPRRPSDTDDSEDLYPLSPLQQGILFHSVYEQGSAIYVGQLSFALHGKIDTEAFSEAWRQVVARHEILRTSFIWENREEPLQRVSRNVEVKLETYDWRESSPVEQQRRLTALLSDDRRLGFDLTVAPLMRLKLVRLGEESYRFVWTHHHLLLDGWSIALLLEEVFAGYDASSPVRQYRDYIAWLRRQDLTRAKTYWRDYLHGFLAPTPLAVDHTPAAPAREADTRRLRLALSHGESERLRTFSRQYQLTLSTLVQGAWALLLSRYSREADVVYGATVAGRPASFAGVEKMMGLFINTLPVRVRLRPGMSIVAWLKDIQTEQVTSREYEHSPLVEVQALSAVPRGTPLFESLLVFENYPLDVGAFGVGARVEVGDVWWFDQTNYPLTVVVRPEPEWSLEILYDAHRFSDDVVQRMLDHLKTILNGFTADAERSIVHVSLVSDNERSVLLSQPNDPTSTLDHCVHQLFEEQARKTPARIALVCGAQRLTYAELNTRANRLARYLLRHGVETESRVCICLEPGLEMIVAVLAVLKTGAAYVPLDPAYPESRLTFMLQDCGARVLLTQGRLLDGRLPGDTARVIAVDEESEEISRESPSDPAIDVRGDNLTYVIYTSGSTGRPKGAGVMHRGFVNLVRWFVSEFELSERDRALIISSFSFDLTQKDLFAPLTLGGQVHFPSSGFYDPAEIVNTISEAEITFINCTPSAFYPLVETAGPRFSPLKYVFLGGEPINVSRLRDWAMQSATEIVNTYGPTEAADVCSSFRVPELERFSGVPAIGKPIDNVDLMIIDEHQNLVPQGIAGELCVGGVGVGRGYLNDPAATAERFIPHPFSAKAGARLYRTGDLVRRLPDGNIEFLNRLDHQVKVAGYRIELGEVESAVVQHRDVKECVVVVRPDAHGDARLVAYLVPEPDAQLDVSALRRYLADSLPAHTIPSLFVALERLPLTPGGKVDRRALPAPDTSAIDHGPDYVAPRTAVEETLAGIWCDVLAVERVGIHDNFLDLGGHSLLAMRCVSAIRQAFRVDLPLRVLFESPSLAELGQALTTYVSSEQKITRRKQEDEIPLSFAQERLWFLDQLEPGSAAYNMPGAVWLEGDLNVEALARSLNEIVRRHEVLRTTFRAERGRPVQVIGSSVPEFLSFTDLTDVSDGESEARRLAAAEAQTPFDLERGPLIRAKLLRLSHERYLLLVTLHHIVADGWSVTLMVQELGDLYAAYVSGRDPALAEPAVSYADYAVWQRQWLTGERLEQQLGYWREQLRGELPVLKLPLARSRTGETRHRGALETVRINADLTARLRELGRREGATLFMTLLAAWQVLLWRLSGERDVVVGTPVAGRGRRELESLIGFFVNTLVLRTKLDERQTFIEVLKQVREVSLGTYAHQEVPFERVVEELGPSRELSHGPLFQVLFALQNAALPQIDLPGLRLRVEDATVGTTKFDLSLEITEEENDLACVWQYDADVFETETIARMARHYQTLLAGIVAKPPSEIHELPLLHEDEVRALIKDHNATPVAYPQQTLLHELFEQQAAITPDAIAVIFEDVRLTYAELDHRANALAHHLLRLGLLPEERVGVVLERSADLVVALLAVLKAGGACVPLDPTYPEERLRLLIEDSGARIVLTHEDLIEVQSLTETAPRRRIDPANVAYVIYTSGSTGRPKGVMVTHAALCNHMRWMRDAFAYNETDVFLQKTPIGFDASIWEFYMPLVVGAKLVMARPGGHQDSSYLARTMIEHGVTVVQLVPMLLRMLVDEPAFVLCEKLRRVFCGGEALTQELATQCLERLPAARLWNLYGPAETTIDATFWEATNWTNTATVPIGKPVANAGAYVLDQWLNPVPLGVVGDLYLDGAGLARGYEGRPDLTADRFLPNPFSDEAGMRMYRTGDLVRRLPGGELEFLGRADGQVKVRGSRVELGEVEAALCAHTCLTAATVIGHEDAAGALRLVAYVVSTDESDSLARRIRAHLKKRLPGHMVPSAFVLMKELPLLPSGKVDRRALPAPERFERTQQAAYRAPRTPVEETLCGIWEEVLGREPVGADDDFFELGGHSLLATQVVSRVKEAFAVELSLTRLFQTPVLSELAEFIEQADTGTGEPQLQRVSREQPLPLSFAQQRLWFLDQFEPANSLYNTPGALRLTGRLDIEALERALSEIVRRHETLRTTFPVVDGNPVQIISRPQPVTIPAIDLSKLNDVDREREAHRLIELEAQRPFDLSHGPLMRATLLRLREEEHLLLFTMHHIISDGWSTRVLAREAAVFYASFTGHDAAPLPALPVQYADYAVWQREWLQGETLAAQLDYWSKQFDGSWQMLELPLDHPRPKVPTRRGAFVPVTFNEVLTKRLNGLSRSEGATLFMTLLAALQALLSRYTGQHDFAIGVPVANRRRREIEGLIGFFVNTLALRADLAGDPTFSELLGCVREVALGAYAHQDVPFEMLVERFQPAREAGRTPLFNVLFVLQNTPATTLEFPGLKIEEAHVGTGTAKFDLMLSLEESGAGLSGVLEYSTELFEETTILRLLAHLETMLEGIVLHPESRISELPLLGPDEERQLIREWNQTATDFPRARCIHELFHEQARQTPDELALIAGEERLTYSELDGFANRLANFLRRQGVGPESVVAVATGRSAKMAIAVLAVLKTGAAYLPLDPEYPHERLSFMLEDVSASAVLTEQHLVERLPAQTPRVICLDRDAESIANESDATPVTGVTSAGLAYVIYTSGSTGRPKAVMMAHRAVCNFIAFQMSSSCAKARTLQFASLNFDVSVQEMFSTWCAGATLVLVEEEVRRDAVALFRVLKEQRVERLFLPFVALQHLAEAADAEDIWPFDLREVITAGEQLKVTPAIERLFERLEFCRLDNQYGPTETHLTTMWKLDGPVREWPRLPPIGGPIANLQVYVLDEHWRPVPCGVVGELYVGGEGLARGYFNRPDQTAERFIPDPFSGEAGARLYKTGDLVRRFDRERLEYVGRSDRQVKVRGFRVEVGEIEAALKSHRDVRQAVVTDWEFADGRKLLAAYVVASSVSKQLTGELKQLLREQLPEYMVPALFTRMDQLPLLPNGKVDRRALPPPDPEVCEDDYVVPRTPVEEVLCGIWEQVLGRERVGADDDFFELGGHSLLATQVMSRVRQAFRVEVALRLLFEHSTPARLAHVIEAEMRIRSELLPPIVPQTSGPLAPLSFAQQRLWILDKLEPHSVAYNLPAALQLDGPLDVAALQRSFEEIVRRHAVLRTMFRLVDGKPMQVIDPSVTEVLSFTDVTDESEAQTPFDLEHGPLIRAKLLRLSHERHLLLVTLHHIVADGWSVTLMVQELGDLYAAYVSGQEPALAEPEVSYADYAVWQRQWLTDERLEQQLGYWREQLRGELPVLKLPLAHARTGETRHRGALETVRINAKLTQAIRELGRREGATLFMTLLAAWQVLLWRLSGERDVVVGTPVAGRGRRELESLIGFFVNTLVLRTKLDGRQTFIEVLKQVREVSLEAYAHQEVPFERVVEELGPSRELSHGPLFQVLFALQNTPTHDLTLTGLTTTVQEIAEPAARFDLALEISETADELDCRLTYDADLFESATIARMAQHLVNVLRAVTAAPQQSISAIDFLTGEERRQLLFEWNRTPVEFSNTRCIHELFEQQVEVTPDATAVAFGAKQLSYRELNERANQWAHRLRRLGAGPEKAVGIAVERSLEMIVGILAILKAGAAYVPLAPDTPPERLDLMMQDAGIDLLLTEQHLAVQLPASESRENPELTATADNLAYLIYTSGSTGRPKGVEVTHRNLVHSTSARFVYYNEPVRSFLLVSPFFFDSSVAGIFWTLCRGGKLVLPPKNLERDYKALAALIEAEQVSHLLCLPAVHSLLLNHGGLQSLRCVIVAGEACPPELPQRHFEVLPRASLYNEYGPTEATVWSTVYECTPHDHARAVPIGRPVPNAQAYVLDDQLQPAPVGVVGELYIGGEGVARGYRNHAAQTAERFVPHPFASGARLYATGDLARWLPNGELEFLGRRDLQIKIRGYRIELGEIEMALLANPAVRDSVVTADGHGVVAYLTVYEKEPTTEALREFLRERLPEYMLPAHFIMLDVMPLGPNGKVDRNALPVPSAARPTMRSAFVVPQTPLEQTIAEVWCEFLQIDTIGVNDIFFELGGHSLLLVRVHEALEKRLNRELPVAALFKFPTVRALAQHLNGSSSNETGKSFNRQRAGERQAALRARQNSVRKSEGLE